MDTRQPHTRGQHSTTFEVPFYSINLEFHLSFINPLQHLLFPTDHGQHPRHLLIGQAVLSLSDAQGEPPDAAAAGHCGGFRQAALVPPGRPRRAPRSAQVTRGREEASVPHQKAPVP
ncbi:hypothetical protein Taro_004986 [Colocasia esculenta]|uniref:Uncharacterized protein n=1 Tax=Colocasia esculenta TaxID=4460 RepID=A0A843TT81_COLES|nr:hypothetical protein [Colocasia esculenta]